ncbi:sugar kinase [Granulosicoccus antarcticus]|uniref:2-dehydro-3-deoxygluconokinase n=1 Tax=Granulosicoccus antarcticus IMCC3135 TaxID=1192854 RepID=A0A2Z2NNK4_9GAMM|nr:sugar kinase [Granulosicoccus antarcticus]ASJ71318.1 2-dehydro-3-deoxygluconokinase [Granulosicoccus antarcticus IMCC3135]
MKIACIGEVMIELSLQGGSQDARLGVAGDTFNTAVYLKRTVSSHDVAYLTVLGTDSFSEQIAERIASENLDVNHIPRTSGRVPGLYAINTDAHGERSFTYWRDQAAARLMFDESVGPSFDVLAEFDVLYYSAITLAILPVPARMRFLSHLERFRAMPGKQVAFDSNYRPRLWASQAEAQKYIADAWRQCDIALPSVDDEMELFNDASEEAALARLQQYGLHKGALKRGAKGPLDLGDPDNTPSFTQVSNVVDSTAAGDSFNGGYLAQLLAGASPMEAARAGHDCASQVVQHRGAIIDIQTS